MKAISIYTITRNQNTEYLQKLERQLSGRDVFLKIREWELESMKSLLHRLEAHMDNVYSLRFIRFRFRDWGKSLICFRSRKNRF